MARKSREYLLSFTAHQAEKVKPSIIVFCPLLKNGSRDVVFCLYKCTKSRLAKCKEYLRVYPDLLNFDIEDKYIEKYGAPIITVPMSLRKRRRRRTAQEIADESRR